MNKVYELLTDESQICFTNGEKITGAKDVTDVIFKCCEEYNAGYLQGRNKMISNGFLIGSIVGVTSIVICGVIIKIKTKKTQK